MRLSDDWRAFADEGWRRAKAQTGFEREEQCPSIMRARQAEPATVGDALASLIADASEDSTTLLRWIALFMLEEVPIEVRAALVETLGQRDPATAALVYEWRADLTETERESLRGWFYPAMPVARARDLARRG